LRSAANRLPAMAEESTPLEAEIRRLIGIAGPMPVAEYMRLCLTHPQLGYYTTRDPIGARGDFITAPEISQMFGELIGLWMASVWQRMGSPENVRVVELGPGRGTLMVDALRAAKTVRNFYTAIVLHLVEISPKLQEMQQQKLATLGEPVLWHPTLTEVPSGPAIVIANEFVDALPVHQAVKQADGWHERMVEVGPDGKLAIGTAPAPLPHFEATLPRELRQAPQGAIYEWRPDQLALELGRRARSDCVALIIDYGHVRQGLGETLQAVAGHSYIDPLRRPGEVDLTAHVDFAGLAQHAEIMGGRIHGPITQRDFLMRLGIERRATMLKAQAVDKSAEIDRGFKRLTATGPKGMGELFKVLAIADPKFGDLPAFGAQP
jgi:NADH dehydrogenase [ubiquinone] 1 alpha subcomplex assembly factor 7